MSNKDSLESLRIDTSKLKEHKAGCVKSVRIKIYLDPEEKKKAKINGSQIPVRIDVDKIRQKVLSRSAKSSYYLKATESGGNNENRKSVIHLPMSKREQKGLRSTKPIEEHQIDYKPLSPDTSKTSEKRRVKEPLSPIRIASREDIMNGQSEKDISDKRKYIGKESTVEGERANGIAKAMENTEAGALMRRGTFIVENCGDRIFLLPVIYNEKYTKRKTLTNLDGLHDFGDFWTFWVSSRFQQVCNVQRCRFIVNM